MSTSGFFPDGSRSGAPDRGRGGLSVPVAGVRVFSGPEVSGTLTYICELCADTVLVITG